ncbi:MAG: metalloprotease TldD [Gammaproteobacteria bacterium]|nr:metalloprotease TldD [Gammaproteobacteria bacterium]
MQEDNFELARQVLLEANGLDENDLQNVIDSLFEHRVDAADIYLQNSRFELWVLENGIIKEGSYNIEQGAGVRAISGEKTGFSYSDEIVLSGLQQAAKAARAIVGSGSEGQCQAWKRSNTDRLYQPLDPMASLATDVKIDLLQRVDAETRRIDSRVQQVIVSMVAAHDTILIAASDGTLAGDVRPLVRFSVSVVVEDNGRREQASSGGGRRMGYDYFMDDEIVFDYAREAVRLALLNLEAVDAPAATMPVVLGPGWPGVLLHEAVGHGLEGDFNRKGTSAFSGRVGEHVASSLCTVVDDGTLEGLRGSLTIDDEGVPTQRTVLIEDGVLKGYMQDKMNARLMGVQSTGNGRRESYAHLPLPRMTNTFMLPGESDPEEIIASVKNGLYAVNFAGGQVDITSGKFVFSTSEAYLIENGKITAPVKGATLVGSGPEVLHHVSMVGNDLTLDQGVGTCGKDGQSVPVGVGQPTLKVDELTVGGTSS